MLPGWSKKLMPMYWFIFILLHFKMYVLIFSSFFSPTSFHVTILLLIPLHVYSFFPHLLFCAAKLSGFYHLLPYVKYLRLSSNPLKRGVVFCLYLGKLILYTFTLVRWISRLTRWITTHWEKRLRNSIFRFRMLLAQFC